MMKILLNAQINLLFHDGYHVSEIGLSVLRISSSNLGAATLLEIVPLVFQFLKEMRWSKERMFLLFKVQLLLWLASQNLDVQLVAWYLEFEVEVGSRLISFLA